MIDASALFMAAMIGSVFMWIVLLFKIVMSPFQEKTKWKLVGILFLFAGSYISIPVVIVSILGIQGYGIPTAIVCSLFLGLVIFNYLVNMNIRRYNKIKQK